MTKVRGFDHPLNRNLGPSRESLRNSSDQLRKGLQTAEKNLTSDEAKVKKSQSKLLELGSKALSLNVQMAQGKPPEALKDELAAVQSELKTALAENEGAVTALGISKKNVEMLQNLVLGHESASDATLQKNGRMREFDVSAVDVTDAGSLTRNEQVRILGRPVEVSVDEATSADRRQVSMSIAVKPENGAAMLALQLKNSPPEVQAALLKKLSDPKRNHLELLMQHAGSSKAVAGALLDAAANATGPARQQLLSALAKHGGTNAAAAAKELIKKGESFEVSAALIRELKAAGKTDAVVELTGAVAGELRELRGQFEKTKKVTDELNGDLARLVVGFGKSLDKNQLAKGVEAFKQGHTKQYDAFESASNEYAKALTLLSAAGDMPVPDQAMTMRVKGAPGMPLKNSMFASEADKALVGFQDELQALAKKNLAALTDTPRGQEALQKAFTQQSAGIPNWVDSLKDLHGVSKDLHGTLSKTLPTIVSQGLGRMALRGTATKEITESLVRNHKLLGLTQEGAESFASIARTLADKKLDPALRNAALEQVKTGEWPPKVKIIGVALALPDLVSGISNFSNAKTVDQLSTIVKGADLTNEIAGLMMKETAFMKVLGKGLGVAGAVLDVAGGVGKILDGETVNGSADIASGVGAGLMLIPGGQLAGAAIIAASLIAKHIWGEDPAADAEKADEKDAKAFLEAAGLKTETAGALSNVRQSDRRNIGTFVDQAAAYLGMSPAALLKKLDALPRAKLDAFTRMVLEMPADKNWKYATKKKFDIYGTDNVRQARTFNASFGPKSMPTAIEWMTKNGIIEQPKPTSTSPQ
ncbi:MAG: hypothetical protein Q8K32_11480 [Archangium sp.]|nr:hypothetical protein [Archangium sp.]